MNDKARMHGAGAARPPRSLQRRTVLMLSIAQVLGGLGLGASLSIGALLVTEVSGSEAWSGLAATVVTLGAAVASVPLARLAQRAGRRPALTLGALAAVLGAIVSIGASSVGSLPLLLLGLAVIGVGTATNLQSRFAAADLAAPESRGRDLSLVVWSTTIGAVAGPNLAEPGAAIGRLLGVPELSGPFVFAAASQLVAAVVCYVGLRPDPLLRARELALEVEATTTDAAEPDARPALARLAVLAVSLSHATMVAVMSMTPVHLVHHGATLSIVGFTISLHIAGMFALSPVFGMLADRLGRVPTILIGQGLFLAALAIAALGSASQEWIVPALVLLGLGWSASTVAGSTLLTEATAVEGRPRAQGFSDTVMSLAGATGGALAGPVLALIGYGGLALTAVGLVAVVLAAVLAVTRGRLAIA